MKNYIIGCLAGKNSLTIYDNYETWIKTKGEMWLWRRIKQFKKSKKQRQS